MAEFRSSARNSGFNSINVPDNARRVQQAGNKQVEDLRRVYDQTIRQRDAYLQERKFSDAAVEKQLNANRDLENDFRSDYKQALRKRQNQEIQKLKDKDEKQLDAYERLGTFSKGAAKLGKELYESNKQERQAYGLSLILQTGVTAEELQALRNKEIDLQVEGAANNEVVQRLKARGAGPAEIKKLQDLNGWALYGAQKALAKNGRSDFYTYINDPSQRRKKFKVDGGEMSLEQAENLGLSSERKNILGQLKFNFLKAYTDYDLTFADQYLFPGIRQVENIIDQQFNAKLANQTRADDQKNRYNAIGGLLDDQNEFALDDYLVYQSGTGKGEALGAARRQFLDDLEGMAKNGLIDRNELIRLKGMKLKVGGKIVTFGEQYLSNSNKSDAVQWTTITRLVDKAELQEETVLQQKYAARNRQWVEQVGQARESKPNGFTKEEALQLADQWKKLPGNYGRPLPQDIINLLTSQDVGVDDIYAEEAARAKALAGGFTFAGQISSEFPNLPQSTVTKIKKIAGFDENGRRNKDQFKPYIRSITEELRGLTKTTNLLSPGQAVLDFSPIVEEKFYDDLNDRLLMDKNRGKSVIQVAQELAADTRAQIKQDNAKDKENKLTNPGFYSLSVDTDGKVISGAKQNFQNASGVPNNYATKTDEAIELLDGNPDNAYSIRLFGKDPNVDRSSLAAEIPLIAETQRAPNWLLDLSTQTGIPWKKLFNAQVALYHGVDSRYSIPVSPAEGMAEVISPEVQNILGNNWSPATLQQASTQQQRNIGYKGYEVYGPILNLIASQESSNDTVDGGYDAMNLGGTNGGHTPIHPTTGRRYFNRSLTDFTLQEIIDYQNQGKLHAAGRYQFVKIAMDDMFERGWMPADVSLDDKFDNVTQDKLAIAYFRRSIQDFESTNQDLVYGLGQRWIGLKKLNRAELEETVRRIQADPRYQQDGFLGYEVDPIAARELQLRGQ